MTYNDPTILHSAECRKCGWKVRDADLLEDGLCLGCANEEAEEDVSDSELYPWTTDQEGDFALQHDRPDWFGIASGIVWEKL